MNNTFPPGVDGGWTPINKMQLAEYVADMALGRLLSNEQVVRDLGVLRPSAISFSTSSSRSLSSRNTFGSSRRTPCSSRTTLAATRGCSTASHAAALRTVLANSSERASLKI